MSEHSIQAGEVLPYRGKGRSMIKKLLPWSRKDGNDPNSFGEPLADAVVGNEDIGCETVHEDEKDIRAEYVAHTLVKYFKGVRVHLTTQYNLHSRTTRSS